MDPVSEFERFLGAEILRQRLLGGPAPTIADRYEVESVLGRGTSGLVVAATDVRLNRSVALKIRLDAGDSGALDEARALARLDHPNVVRVYDVSRAHVRFGAYEREVFIVTMARVYGRTLRVWLRDEAPSVVEIVRVLTEVGRGLAAAHAVHIVHRDMKPDNVIVRADGHAQVLDFGFAVQAAPTQSQHGGVRGSAGTDPYMAPEARLGRTSRASDQFSLGITLVEALTGEPRPAGADVPEDVPVAVWEVARRATAPVPKERYADLGAMVDALTTSLERRRAPSRAVVGTALAVSALIALGVGALVVRGRVSPSPETRRPERVVPASARAQSLAMDTAHDAATPPSDAAAPTDAATSPTDAESEQIDATLDAGAPRAAAVADASVRPCRFVSGQLRFRTIDERPSAPQGVYALGIDERGGTLRELSLRRIAPMRDQLEVRRHVVREDCSLELEAHAESRAYTFELTIANGRVHGRFRTTGGASYTGRVVPNER